MLKRTSNFSFFEAYYFHMIQLLAEIQIENIFTIFYNFVKNPLIENAMHL